MATIPVTLLRYFRSLESVISVSEADLKRISYTMAGFISAKELISEGIVKTI